MGKTSEEWADYQEKLEADRIAREASAAAKQAELERMIAARGKTKYSSEDQPRLNDLYKVSTAQYIDAQKVARANPPEWALDMALDMPMPPQDPAALVHKRAIINGTEPAGGAQ